MCKILPCHYPSVFFAHGILLGFSALKQKDKDMSRMGLGALSSFAALAVSLLSCAWYKRGGLCEATSNGGAEAWRTPASLKPQGTERGGIQA